MEAARVTAQDRAVFFRTPMVGRAGWRVHVCETCSQGIRGWVRDITVTKTLKFWQEHYPNCNFMGPPPYPLLQIYDGSVRGKTDPNWVRKICKRTRSFYYRKMHGVSGKKKNLSIVYKKNQPKIMQLWVHGPHGIVHLPSWHLFHLESGWKTAMGFAAS
jgi:hypothetical protein